MLLDDKLNAMKKNNAEKNIVFIWFAAVCCAVIVFALPFYWLGASAGTAFLISIMWLALSVPFGCIVGAYLWWRNNSNPPVYRIAHKK
ncbi:hypothetical protein KGQ34_00285 [Patescibacteria group bacterium]|nr:hypothetical protein [Patescibacteria group bacterium]